MSDQDQPGDAVAALTDHAALNRAMWERTSDDYERRHAESLAGQHVMSWGLWRIPESELRILGEVAGKDMLEYGCGAARWSIARQKSGSAHSCSDSPRRRAAYRRSEPGVSPR